MVLEGTGDQLLKHLQAYPKQLFRLETISALNGAEVVNTGKPNQTILQALRELSKLHESMNESDPAQTDRLIREARSGGMYGTEPTE